MSQRRLSRAPVEQGGWSLVPIVWNGIDLVNPLSNPAVSQNCSPHNPGWYCAYKGAYYPINGPVGVWCLAL